MKLADVLKEYAPTIGIECHVQLKTKTKLFSGANNDARGAAPNTTVNQIDFGFPGVLPVLNDEALTLAIKAGLALNATIPEISRFERKHYFYPDLPLGYQITQLAEPVIVGGTVTVMADDEEIQVRIHHAHLESDAGKLTHPAGASHSLVDLNRVGTPLIEIVTEPDMHSPSEARAFAQTLYGLMTYAGVTYGDLYHGNMRFDVNISLAPHGSSELGTRAEIKNLNSFRSVEKAAEYECLRQAEILSKGDSIVQETRGWNEATQKTVSQRSKEDAHDYRYFPDADIPPVRIPHERVDKVRTIMPKLPQDYRKEWAALRLDESVVSSLLASSVIAQTISTIIDDAGGEHATRIAHWFVSAVDTNEDHTETKPPGGVEPERLIALSRMVGDGLLSSTAAKAVFNELAKSNESAEDIAQRLNVLQVSNEDEINTIALKVIADPSSQKAIADIRSGNDKAIGYLVGQVMKLSGGKANPSLAQKMLRKNL